MRRTTTALLASAASAVLAVSLAASAPAGATKGPPGHHHEPRVSEPLASNLLSPLGLAVQPDGTLYVAQTFAGQLTKIDRKGVPSTAVQSQTPGVGPAGIAFGRRGSVLYTLAGGEAPDQVGSLNKLLPDGTSRQLADTAGHERTKNPDQVNSYGFQGLTAECAAQVPAQVGGGTPTPGVVDSNTYAVANLPGFGRVIADAGGNDLLLLRRGKLKTLAVLPPVPTVVTKEIAAGMGLPECTIGATYNFDFVPTDVEVGPHGMLYVSSLPGGPEDASLGARGGVYRVNPWTGKVRRVATGFLGAVDLAVSPHGTVYVAEMFAGAISVVHGKHVRKLVDLPSPGALEWARGRLYATTTPDLGAPQGTVVTIKP